MAVRHRVSTQHPRRGTTEIMGTQQKGLGAVTLLLTLCKPQGGGKPL